MRGIIIGVVAVFAILTSLSGCFTVAIWDLALKQDDEKRTVIYDAGGGGCGLFRSRPSEVYELGLTIREHPTILIEEESIFSNQDICCALATLVTPFTFAWDVTTFPVQVTFGYPPYRKRKPEWYYVMAKQDNQ